MTIRNAALLILSLAILSGCGEETPSIPRTMVEAASPAIGADGKLAQSIGIETLGGVFTPLLSQGSVVPCGGAEVFSTVDDNQKPDIGREIRAALFSPADSPTWFIFALGLAIVVAYGIASMVRLKQGIPHVDRVRRLVMIAVGAVIWGIGEAVFRTMRWFEMEPYASSIAAKMDPLIFCIYPLIRFTFLGAIALALAITFELLDSRRRQVSRRSS